MAGSADNMCLFCSSKSKGRRGMTWPDKTRRDETKRPSRIPWRRMTFPKLNLNLRGSAVESCTSTIDLWSLQCLLHIFAEHQCSRNEATELECASCELVCNLAVSVCAFRLSYLQSVKMRKVALKGVAVQLACARGFLEQGIGSLDCVCGRSRRLP